MITTVRSVLGDRPRNRSRDRLHLIVAGDLEEKILSGAIDVGERLPSEGEIARDYAVSTRSVREAMQVLETKGLVRRRHGERTEVVRADVAGFLGTLALTVRHLFSSDPEYLNQLMVVRRMIETEAIGLLTLPGAEIAPSVAEALEAMRQARDAGDFSGFIEADAAFHAALVRSANNEIMSLFYEKLHALIIEVINVTSRVPSKSLNEAYAEHETLFRTIASRDEVEAKRLMRAHIDNSAAYLKVAIENAKKVHCQ